MQKNKLKKKDRKSPPHCLFKRRGGGSFLVGKALKCCFVPKAISEMKKGDDWKGSRAGEELTEVRCAFAKRGWFARWEPEMGEAILLQQCINPSLSLAHCPPPPYPQTLCQPNLELKPRFPDLFSAFSSGQPGPGADSVLVVPQVFLCCFPSPDVNAEIFLWTEVDTDLNWFQFLPNMQALFFAHFGIWHTLHQAFICTQN